MLMATRQTVAGGASQGLARGGKGAMRSFFAFNADGSPNGQWAQWSSGEDGDSSVGIDSGSIHGPYAAIWGDLGQNQAAGGALPTFDAKAIIDSDATAIANGFKLKWTLANGEANIIRFIAIGGPGPGGAEG